MPPESASVFDVPLPQKYALNCAIKENHNLPIYCVAFSPSAHAVGDGDRAACFATCGGGYATIYEVVSSRDGNGKRKARPQSLLEARQVYRDVDDGETFYTCAFGGRGAGAPIAGEDVTDTWGDGVGGAIRFGRDGRLPSERPASDRLPKRRRRCNRSPFSLALAEGRCDGPPLLCLGGTRGIIKVIDTVRRCLCGTLSGHGNDITDLKFSPTDEWLLLSASKDESVRLWNLRRGACVAAFAGHNGHRGQVLSVSWHLDGTRFASCGMDNAVKLWRVLDGDDGTVEPVLRRSLGVVPDDWGDPTDNGRPATRGRNEFGTVFQQFPYFSTNKVHTNYVDCVQFAGDLILSKSVSNKVVLWKPILNEKSEDGGTVYSSHRVPSSILFLREFELEHCDSWYIRFDSPSPHHRLLALGNQAGDVKVWTIGADGDDDRGCHPSQRYFCSLSTNGCLGGGGGEGDGADSGVGGGPSTVRMVAFNPHGSGLVAVRDDATVWLWSAA